VAFGNYAGQRISDGHGGGTYEISDVLAKSSNVGTAKLITKYYADKPKVFLDHLKRWKMFDKMDIELPGITKPFVLHARKQAVERSNSRIYFIRIFHQF